MAVTALAVLLPASPAAGWTCAPLDTSGSPIVLVGTVESAGSDRARFAVEEVWAGPDLAPVVELQTGADPMDGSVFLSRGERYVVTADESLRTGYCQVFLVDESEVARPAEVREPVAGGLTGRESPRSQGQALAWGASGTTLAAGLLLLARRRGRTTRAVEEDTCAGHS
jgi:hypothetical protein